MNNSEKPQPIQFAIVFILMGLVCEIIGLSVNAVRSIYGEFNLVIAHALMLLTTFSTIKYLIDLEKNNSDRGLKLLWSVIANIFFILIIIYLEHSNAFILTAELFNIVGVIFLLFPASIMWFRDAESEKTV